MNDLAALLDRLKTLDEQKNANAKEIDQEQARIMREENLPLKETASAYLRARKNVGRDFVDEIFEALDQLLPVYPGLPEGPQAEVRRVIAACGNIHQALAAYVTHAAKQIEGPEDASWLQNALAAALIDGGSLQDGRAFQAPLEQLYVSAYEAGLNPDEHIEAARSIADLETLRYIQRQFSRSDQFKRLAIRKPGEDQLIEKLGILFDEDLRDLMIDLIDLSGRQDAWDARYNAELTRLMAEENRPYAEASQLAEESTGPGWVDEMLGGLDRLCPAYLGMDASQRSLIREVVHTHHALLRAVAGYAGRAADRLSHHAEPDWLRYGLAAVAMEDGCIDFRDTLMRLGDLYRAAWSAGLAPDEHYRQLGDRLGSAYLRTFTESAHFLKDVRPTLDPREDR